MKDHKTVTVAPAFEDVTIETYKDFGYDLMSSQEIFSQDSRPTQGILDMFSGDITIETTTTHYVKLVFERDHSIPHYEELKALEDQYNAVYYPGDSRKPYSMRQIFWGLMACTIPGVYMIYRNMVEGKSAKQYQYELTEWRTKQSAIREKAAALVRA